MPEILSRLGVRLWLFPGCGGTCGLCPGSGAWRARLGFWGLACWWASVALCLWFRLWTWSVIAIWVAFAVLGWLLVVPVGPIGPCWPGGGPFRAVGGGGGLVGCVQGRELGARASPSEVYPAGKLH